MDVSVILEATGARDHRVFPGRLDKGTLGFAEKAIVLALLGSAAGVASGWVGAMFVAAVSPLPAQVTAWSVALAVMLSGGVGILFGVYPAARAARLAPVAAMRPD